MVLKDRVYEKLNAMNISYYVVNHKAIFSKEDTEDNIFDNDVIIGKNLFLRNKEYLNIATGSVSYLNVITANEEECTKITYVIDKELFKSSKVGFPPSDNTATVVTSPDNILRLYEEYNLKYKILEI